MRKVFLALFSATALSIAPAAHADVNINFSSPPGELDDDQDYSAGGLTVTASGYTTTDVDEHLFGKNLGGDENGVGLVTDGQHEIYGPDAFIQLDVSQILGLATGADFFMNSTTNGEQWSVWGSDTDAGGKVGGTLLLTGSDEGVLHALPGWGLYDFYNFFAVGANDNVLLGGLTIHEAVPEPATWAMMLLGFGAIGVAFRRRRPKDLAQLA
jgi:hypothetical protein